MYTYSASLSLTLSLSLSLVRPTTWSSVLFHRAIGVGWSRPLCTKDVHGPQCPQLTTHPTFKAGWFSQGCTDSPEVEIDIWSSPATWQNHPHRVPKHIPLDPCNRVAKKLLLAVELVTLMATYGNHSPVMVHITSQITGHKLYLLDMGIVDDSRIVHESPMLGALAGWSNGIQRNTSVWIFPWSSMLRIPNGCHWFVTDMGNFRRKKQFLLHSTTTWLEKFSCIPLNLNSARCIQLAWQVRQLPRGLHVSSLHLRKPCQQHPHILGKASAILHHS